MKVFLFDFDGVIINTLPIAVEVYNSLFQKYEIDTRFTEDTFSDLFLSNFHEGLSQVITNEEIRKKILNERADEYIKRKNDFEFFDGIEKVLQLMSKDNKVIVISSNHTNYIETLLFSGEIKGISEVLGGDIEKSKEKKIEWQKIKYPESEIYYIGDTTGDIKEGKESEVITVGATWGFHSSVSLEKESPDFLFNKPEELITLI